MTILRNRDEKFKTRHKTEKGDATRETLVAELLLVVEAMVSAGYRTKLHSCHPPPKN